MLYYSRNIALPVIIRCRQTNGTIFSGCALLCMTRTSHYYRHLRCYSIATFILFSMFVIMRRYTGNHGCLTQKKDKEIKKKKEKAEICIILMVLRKGML